MPRLALGTRALSSYSGDTVVIGLTAAKPTKTSRKKASTALPEVVTSVELGDELAKGVAAAVEVLDPSTAVGATTVAPAPAGLKAKKLLLVGLGDGEVTTDVVAELAQPVVLVHQSGHGGEVAAPAVVAHEGLPPSNGVAASRSPRPSSVGDVSSSTGVATRRGR